MMKGSHRGSDPTMENSLLPCKSCKADAEFLQETKMKSIVCHCHDRHHVHKNLRTASIPTCNSEDSRLVLLTARRCGKTFVHTQPSNMQLHQHNWTVSSPDTPTTCGTCPGSITHCVQRHQANEKGSTECTRLNCRGRSLSIHHQLGKSCFRPPKLSTVTHILLSLVLSLVLFTHASRAAANVEISQQVSRTAPRNLKWDSFDIERVELSKTTHKASFTPVTDSRQIPDSVAVVGRLFQLQIPPTVFSEPPFVYKVSCAILVLMHTYIHCTVTIEDVNICYQQLASSQAPPNYPLLAV